METKMSAENLANYTMILEWLYRNDNAFKSSGEWREAFIQKLRKIFETK
jgi:hypothetical protein